MNVKLFREIAKIVTWLAAAGGTVWIARHQGDGWFWILFGR